MKSIIKTTGKLTALLTALFVYASAGRLMYALYGDLTNDFACYLYFAIVCGFMTLVSAFSFSLIYTELIKK